MSNQHQVQQGEFLSKIAAQYKFNSYETIWNHPNNAQLKAKRKSPNVLFAGDILFIPDKQAKEAGRPTDAGHTSLVQREKVQLQVILQRFDKRPIANAKCIVQFGDDRYPPLVSNGDGLITQEIKATAESGSLKFEDPETALVVEIPLKVGYLDPPDEEIGWHVRLKHLGYDPGPSDPVDEQRLASAIEEFQCENDLHVDGVCGPKTQAKLRLVHGC